MTLPDELLRRIEEDFRVRYAGVNAMNPRRAAEELGDERRAGEQLALLERATGEPVAGKRLLEIGNGLGLFQAAARAAGALACGVEPDPFHCDVSRAVLRGRGLAVSGVVQAVGERLPFADGAFDLVCSFQVLEHVHDPRRVLAEAARVLRPGGYLHFVVPNYGSVWEGHYNVWWIPHSPRWLAKGYVRLLGRRADFIDELQMVTVGRLRRIVADLPLRVLSWGAEVWAYRLRTLDFSEWSELRRLKAVARWLRWLRLVELVRVVGERLELFTPIVLTAQRVITKDTKGHGKRERRATHPSAKQSAQSV